MRETLLVGCVLHPLLHRLQSLHLSAQAGDFVLDASGPDFGDIAHVAVGPVQRRQVAHNACVNLLHSLDDLGDREFLVAVVHGFELAAVNRDNGPSEKTKTPA